MSRKKNLKPARSDRDDLGYLSVEGNAPRTQSQRKWGKCESCGQHLPLIPEVGLCGPCTFGEAETLLDD